MRRLIIFSRVALTVGRSNPLSPATRLEEASQTRKCGRLRRAVQRSLLPLVTSYYKAFEGARPLAVEGDLEKYYDIYEISRSDIQEAEDVPVHLADKDDTETLKALKLAFQKLHINRKLYLCSLLALSADGSRSDFRTWSAASESLEHVASETARMTDNIDEILSEEEGRQTKCPHIRISLTFFARLSCTPHPQDTPDTR